MLHYTLMTLLQLKSITKHYPPDVTAVSQVNLSIDAGDVLCLLGPSGCGKTTLLRCIAGLEQPDSGSVWFEGQDVTHQPPHRRDFGMMFQDFALFPHRNVFDNVAFGLKMRGDSSKDRAARVEEMLDLVDLAPLAQRTIDQLSGGEQQRVALARALAPGPRLLLLDEPLGSLDRALRERLMLELRQILQAVAVTAVYVTHDQTEAFAIADQVAVMRSGHIEQVAAPEEIYERPATPFVAQFVGFENLIPGRQTETAACIQTPLGPMRLATATDAPPDTSGQLLLKPDGATLVAEPTAENGVSGEVTAVSFRGRYYQLWLQTADSDHPLMFEFGQAPSCYQGESVHLALSPESLRWYPD
jgi:ABC-type Fe3+/spermidine/putrescine transport system ATPase subunit